MTRELSPARREGGSLLVASGQHPALWPLEILPP